MLTVVGSTRYRTGTSGIGYRGELMFLDCSACYSHILTSAPCLQVDCNSLAPKVVDPEHAANDIPTKVVED